MSAKVVDFLNESGGSNFTESAPRPPTYGEENELQSNEGNSTKSSNSHKSHGSNKSHSSTKSGTSAKGDHAHSPASTPRKSNLEGIKAGDVMIGVTNSSLVDCEDSEAGAPLGFEPEGSAANSPPYSENGQPSHLRWAENLRYLLDDSEGVMLFREFLENEVPGGSQDLRFWFTCQGFKKELSTDSSKNSDKQKAIYRHYVRGDKIKCLSRDVKDDITEKICNWSYVDPCVFDAALEEVETFMRNETYPAFLLSNYYLEYVQNYTDSPKSSPSSGSNSARPVSQSGLLPVVHEDKELGSEDLLIPMTLPLVSNKVSSNVRRTDNYSGRHTETVTGSALHPSRRPYYHVSYVPVSAQDSELQSLSSDALTDDALSITDGSVDGYSHRLASKKHHRKALHNRESHTGLTTKIIPRTQQAPKEENLAEVDPEKFVAQLTVKLNKVLEGMETSAKMEEKLQSITVTTEMNKTEPEERLLTSFVKANTSASFIPLPSAIEEETAESILDQHCSRIWESSAHHTPSSFSPPRHRSPPHRSPDRHKDLRKKTAAHPASASASATYSSRHKKRDLVTYDFEDHNVIVSGTETHRHFHQHHHYHQTRDSPYKKSYVELESQTSGISSWRADNVQNLSSDFSSGEATTRGRPCSRKSTCSMARKVCDTSSNVDSGISLMDSSKGPPNLNHPASEKVMKWMMNTVSSQNPDSLVLVPDLDQSLASSHKAGANQPALSSQQNRTRSRSSARSTSVERNVGSLSAWGGAAPILPTQPIAQDPCMPPLTPPNPTTQLVEAKRRLETQSKMSGVAAASPFKSKNGTGVLTKDKVRPPTATTSFPATSTNRTMSTARPAPAHMDTPVTSRQLFDSRLGHRTMTSSSYQATPSGETIIGIYMGQEPIPYRHQLPGRAITLAQIKALVTKKGHFRFYFKRHSDEFGDTAGAVFEEITDNNTIVPMWQGKIVVKVEKLEL